jgi:hypothetical protein
MTYSPDGDELRYRRAAEEAVRQLDWCIWYIRKIRKYAVARMLSARREAIQKQLQR